MKLRQLFEALTKQQKQYVDDIIKQQNLEFDETRYDDIFGVGNTRLYLPMPETTQSTPNQTVIQTLNELGYHVSDYRAGYAVAITPRKYDIKIVLGKNPELLSLWGNDPSRNDSTQSPNNQVLQTIEKMGYDIVDYKSGTLTRENKPEAIGSIFKKYNVDPSINQLFMNDKYRLSGTKDDLEELNTNNQIIVITRDKYEAAEVGTNKRWGSCLNLGGGWTGVDKLGSAIGVNQKYAATDVAFGTMAAYLINKNDTELDDPIARLSIKPFINEHDPEQVALGVHDKVYHRTGRPYPEIFKTIVHQWADQINKSKAMDGIFHLHPDVYDFHEFDSRTRYHGNYKRDKETYDQYNTQIHLVPEELRTIGYYKLVAEKSGEYSRIYEFCNMEEAFIIAEIGVKRNSLAAAVFIPEEYVNKNIDIFYDLVEQISKSENRIVDAILLNYNQEMIQKLYAHDSKKFLSICKQVLKKPNDYVLDKLTENLTDIQILSDIAKLKKLPSYAISNILDHVISGEEEIDIDVLKSLINNPNIRSSDMAKLAEYAEDTENSQLESILNSREDNIIKSIIDDINSAETEDELIDIMKDFQSIHKMGIEIPEEVYASVYNNKHLVSDSMLRLGLTHLADSTVVSKVITHNPISPELLGWIANEFYGDSLVLMAIEKKWLTLVPTIKTNEDANEFIQRCSSPVAVMEFIESNELTEQQRNIIISKITFEQYDTIGLLKLATKMIPYIEYPNRLFNIDKVFNNNLYKDDEYYTTFKSALNDQVISIMESIDDYEGIEYIIDNGDYKNKKIFNSLLEKSASNIGFITQILNNINRRYDHNVVEPMLMRITPYIERFLDEEPDLIPFYARMYQENIPIIQKMIIEKTPFSLLLEPKSNDTSEILKAKLDKLIECIKNNNYDIFYISRWLYDRILPEKIQKELLKQAIKDNNMDLLTDLYGNTESNTIIDKIDKFLGSKFKYETLNQALAAAELMDEWPLNRSLSYGENATVPAESGGLIKISRGMNGKYTLPTIEYPSENSNDESTSLRELIKKGRETGVITYSELDEVLPKDLTHEQIDDILDMIEEMNIKLVSG